MRQSMTAALAVVASMSVIGCGGGAGDGPPPPPPGGGGGPPVAGGPPAGAGAKQAWSPEKGAATVSGRVAFDGTPPTRKPVDMSREAACHAHHGGKFLDESVLVGPDGGVGNVFVWVKKGLDGWTFAAPAAEVTLDQKNCAYVPHVVGVQVGQPLRIKNGDGFMHNVHAFPKKNEDFNFSQAGGSDKSVTFRRAEVPLPLKCDVHGWMGSYACVVDHPFFAVTGADGRFTLPKLPPGTYTLAAWHEVYGQKDLSVTVSGTETKSVEFTFAEDDE